MEEEKKSRLRNVFPALGTCQGGRPQVTKHKKKKTPEKIGKNQQPLLYTIQLQLSLVVKLWDQAIEMLARP